MTSESHQSSKVYRLLAEDIVFGAADPHDIVDVLIPLITQCKQGSSIVINRLIVHDVE